MINLQALAHDHTTFRLGIGECLFYAPAGSPREKVTGCGLREPRVCMPLGLQCSIAATFVSCGLTLKLELVHVYGMTVC